MDKLKQSERSNAAAIELLSAVWVVTVLTVNPSGEFPINDDWSYALAVRTLVQTHTWHLTAWTSMPLATQMLWGALFSVPFGFSHFALRLSTLVAGWVAVIGMYRFLQLCGASDRNALLGALTLMFCPLFFALAFTFMTDVPFIACGVWAAVWALEFARSGHTRHATFAVVLVVAATLLRQLGLTLAIGGAAAALASGREPRRRMGALVMVLAPIIALMAYEAFLDAHGAPAEYKEGRRQLSAGLNGLGVETIKRAIITLLLAFPYLGLLLLPAGLLVRHSLRDRVWLTLFTALSILPAWYFVSRQLSLPLYGNVFHDFGLNPVLVSRADLWPHSASMVWISLTGIGVVSAAALLSTSLVRLVRHWTTVTDHAKAALALTTAGVIVYSVPLLITGRMFDRYLLLPVLLGMGALAAIGQDGRKDRAVRASISAAALVICIAAVFDIAAVHDYLSFNRARWTAVHELLESGLRPGEIEGGFEVDAWLSYRDDAPRTEWLPPRANPAAVISLGPIDGLLPAASYPFSTWIGGGLSHVYVLR
jgi:hypothetical protein